MIDAINKLPQKCPLIDSVMADVVQDKDCDLNSRLVAIDILGNSNPELCFENICKVILNIKDYVQTGIETLYLLDVVTKALKMITQKAPTIVIKPLLDELNNLQFNNISDDEGIDKICRRIQERMKAINDTHNSVN